MKTSDSFSSKQEAIELYKSFLQNQVLAFRKEELVYMTTILENCIQQIHDLNPNILPDSIHLIKTDGSGYGKGAYYTRENAIIIPQDELGNEVSPDKLDHIESVIFHELFHIISRTHPALKNRLYNEIGFEKLHAKLVIPEVLRTRKLLNPDGIDIAYFIRLKGTNQLPTKLAIPIITSGTKAFNADNPLFFSYINFDLYEIEQIGESMYGVICDSDGISKLEDEYKANFFSQIADNTDYIIHPDEIMADNFTFCLKKDDLQNPSSFSSIGMQLIAQVRSILTSVN